MNVFRNSALARKALLDLHFPAPLVILDTTAARGGFYKLVPDRRIYRGDIRTCVLPDYIGDVTKLPIASDAVDVAVLDPPYKRGSRNTGGTTDMYEHRYGKAPGSENAATKVYYLAIKELVRVARCGMIIKLQDAADGHVFHDRRFLVTKLVEQETGLRPMDVALVYRSGLTPTLTHGSRRFLRQHVSYFVVWKWSTKVPKLTQFRW